MGELGGGDLTWIGILSRGGNKVQAFASCYQTQDKQVPHFGYYFSHLFLAAKNSNSEKTKSSKDPNKEPSSLFQREGVHMLLGELSRKFPPQFLQGQTTTGKLADNSLVYLLITTNLF